jgi:hypothetical protein
VQPIGAPLALRQLRRSRRRVPPPPLDMSRTGTSVAAQVLPASTARRTQWHAKPNLGIVTRVESQPPWLAAGGRHWQGLAGVHSQ